MQINTMDDFLSKYIEGYLFTDVKTIKEKVSKNTHPGNAAYLMTSALCSGIEFLGFLLRERKATDEINSSFAFEHYCKHYLKNIDPRYETFGIIGRELIRNGIAHSFATKGKIGITRQGNRETAHLVRYADAGIVVINPDFLYEDFEKSYYKFALPLISEGGDLRQRVIDNYEGLKDKYNVEIENTMQQAARKLERLPWFHKEVKSQPYTLEAIEENGELPLVS